MVVKRAVLADMTSKIMPVLKEYKVTKAGIFGSFARGEQKKKSDVDILVKAGKDWSLFELIDLKLALEKSLKRKVDLVEYDNIRSEIRENILNDEISVLK